MYYWEMLSLYNREIWTNIFSYWYKDLKNARIIFITKFMERRSSGEADSCSAEGKIPSLL